MCIRDRTFFDHVQKFNNAVDPAWLTTGFENAKPSDLKYDPYSCLLYTSVTGSLRFLSIRT